MIYSIRWLTLLYQVELNLAILILSLGGWGKIKIRDHLSPAEAEVVTNLDNKINQDDLMKVPPYMKGVAQIFDTNLTLTE